MRKNKLQLLSNLTINSSKNNIQAQNTSFNATSAVFKPEFNRAIERPNKTQQSTEKNTIMINNETSFFIKPPQNHPQQFNIYGNNLIYNQPANMMQAATYITSRAIIKNQKI